MKKTILLILIISCSHSIFSQSPNKLLNQFVIKGEIENFSESSFDLQVSGMFDGQIVSVPVSTNGKFIKTISIEGTQDFVLAITDYPIEFFAVPGDTILVEWDQKNILSSLKISSKQPDRNIELNLILDLFKNYFSSFLEIYQQATSKEIPDSVKNQKVKLYFENEIKFVHSRPSTINSRKIYSDIYYKTVQAFSRIDLLKLLSFEKVLPKKIVDNLHLKEIHFDTENEKDFYQSSTYRDLFVNQLRFQKHNDFPGYVENGNNIRNDCYKAMACLSSQDIRDWFLVYTIKNGFRYEFKSTEAVYKEFFPKIKTRKFKDQLQKFYTDFQRLKPGSPAINFTLKDSMGKNISLSSFKGKVVFIDFWGVNCSPCIYDIQNSMPKLHEKYNNKDVVFINICVDSKTKKWKESLKKINVPGINLIAEGWTSNPVCKAYQVNGIPHYLLIDRQGNIVDNNVSLHPEMLIWPGNTENMLDHILKAPVK